MKTLKNIMAATTLLAILTLGTTFAKADGILVAGIADSGDTGCTETSKNTTVRVDSGILVAGFTGILVAGLREFCRRITGHTAGLRDPRGRLVTRTRN